MPSRSKIAPELGKTAVQNSRVERREICSDMGIHAREPITNHLNGKGQNTDSPGHSFFKENFSWRYSIRFWQGTEDPCSRQCGYRKKQGKGHIPQPERITGPCMEVSRPSRIAGTQSAMEAWSKSRPPPELKPIRQNLPRPPQKAVSGRT